MIGVQNKGHVSKVLPLGLKRLVKKWYTTLLLTPLKNVVIAGRINVETYTNTSIFVYSDCNTRWSIIYYSERCPNCNINKTVWVHLILI